LWKVRYDGYSNVVRPVYAAGLLFISTGYDRASLWAIRPEGTGDISATSVAWKNTKDAPLDPSPVFCGGSLYVVTDAGVASCLDPTTGKEAWRHRMGSDFSASLIVAEGRVYFFGENGDTTVIKPGPKYEEVAVNHLDSRIMATPAFVDHEIYLRTDKAVYRIEK
jgi:outer membrane protein assembly factor BamB